MRSLLIISCYCTQQKQPCDISKAAQMLLILFQKHATMNRSPQLLYNARFRQ